MILDRMDTLDFDQQTEELIPVDDKVVALVRWIGRGKTSGAHVDMRVHFHFKVRDGKVVYTFEYEDKADALQAAGLSE